MAWPTSSAASRGYDYAWQKRRLRILDRDNHLCRPCLASAKVTPARQVDHIVPKARGGTDDDANLQAICKGCHDDKTARENGAAVKPEVGEDGWPRGWTAGGGSRNNKGRRP